MLRRTARHTSFVLLLLFATACGSVPLPPPTVVPFETKMSWMIRLEDQRMLRDAAPPIAPPPTAAQDKRALLPPPPPPPDLIRLLDDTEARVRRRAAIAVGRVGLSEGVAPLVRLLQADTDPEVR